MTRSRILLISLLAALATAPAAGAASSTPTSHRSKVLGISENVAGVFANPFFRASGMGAARLVVPWDATKHAYAYVDNWMAAVRTVPGVKVMIVFAASPTRHAGTLGQYTSAVKAFIKKYPFVKYAAAFNEPSDAHSFLQKNPKEAAHRFDALLKICGSKCTALTGEFAMGAKLPNRAYAVDYAKAMLKVIPKKNQKKIIWGLHNYVDVNRLQTTWTKAFVKAIKVGKIWYTETGGIVKRIQPASTPASYRYNKGSGPAFAAKATNYLLTTLRKVPGKRMGQIYLYQWFANPSGLGFGDAGLIDVGGLPRPAFDVAQKFALKT
jgi:hypothetical protein